MSDNTEEKTKDVSWTLATVFGVATVIAALVLFAYFKVFGAELSQDHSRWGQFGDYLGGVLNPVFGFLGLFALLLTISLQVKELKLTRDEIRNSTAALKDQNNTLKLQNFENSFFQMLRLHNEIVNSIDFVRSGSSTQVVTTRGRDCFPVMWDRLHKTVSAMNSLRAVQNQPPDSIESMKQAYEKFYDKHQVELGHYFRYLYNIFKFLKSSEIENRKFYSNLVRAQLSNHELAIIYYNCLSGFGKEKFYPLAVEFSLFKNMPRSLLYAEDHKDLYPDAAFG